MKKKLAVVHYLPLEFYPPVTNLLNCISESNTVKTQVFSTHNNKDRKAYTNNSLDAIFRVSAPKEKEHIIIRLFKYILFNLYVFFKLCVLRPDAILYYESYSVGPVYWYFKLFGNNTKLYIHYHEYASSNWYKNGMKLVKLYHKQEQSFLYQKAVNISQTNKDRIALFLKDNPMVSKDKMLELPNYPAKSWNEKVDKVALNTEVIKTVYVGSLSLKDTYIQEYCEWVEKQNGKVIFDIYAYNLHQDTIDYLIKLNSKWINFNQKGVEYNEMPKLLPKYNVGVILYKASTDNYKFNAPNKLFEYMACGLEVWYSDKMLGIRDYNKQTSPRILSVNFTDINTTALLNSTKLTTEDHQQFFAEFVYIPYINTLIL
ncbi:hypothetical protein [Polaribacter sargassicola]|uniref:hypothetical protein n=1 Tax=Polaribacter sargassicola TaxID=2836891 RepID=UPI001F1E93D6|nr:hypothetical protein [Polaribacter sp. DS7-9]MCG1036557.1 hypothetical protein [Polaribacter sp. DS7-9]